jgi:signal transduction histidine kinase
MRAIITELRNATDSENAITALANGIHRLIHSEITFVQFFAGAEDRDLASLKRGDTSATFDFGNQGIDREFSSEMSKVAQKIWHESEAGSVSIKEISDSLSTNALNELKKLGLDESSVIMPVSEGQVVLGYVVFKNSDNGLLPPNQLSAVQSAVGQAANSIGAIRSSSLVQRIRENEQVVSELRALDRLKDEFTANVNHELRTPLTSIIGYLELVLSDSQNLPAATLDYLETVRRNADRLTELIERLLVVARSDSQSEVLMRTEVDLAQVIRDAVQVVGQKDSTKSVDIKIKIDDGHFNIFGDKLRLEQIVVNLVSNAVKFSKSYSTVFVELRRLKSVIGGNPEVELTIRDSGIGIPANETANLFNRFFRASNATKALIPGTGLGLSIVKQFVEDHDGNISINSVVGQGTTVSVRLPLAPIKLV